MSFNQFYDDIILYSLDVQTKIIGMQTKKITKKIFGIKMPFNFNSKISDNFQQTGYETLGSYVGWTDSITIFHKIIYGLCKKYNSDYKSVLQFTLIHETGHAKENRLFDEIGFFSDCLYTKKITIPAQINSTIYQIQREKVRDTFLSGVYDFSVNEELKKNQTFDLKSHKVYFGRQNTIIKSCSKTRTEEILDCLLNLPNKLDMYEHGDLNEQEKITLKESQKKVIGEQWETTLDSLNKIDFFNPELKLAIILELLKNTIGIQAKFVRLNIEEIFKDNSEPAIPNIYKKKYYRVLYLG
jgi:hypothetical protein